MSKIRFSHDYLKFPRKLPFKAVLLQTFVVESSSLTPQLVEYDTMYFDDSLNVKHFELPDSEKYIVLILKTGNEVFTTIRSYNLGKYEFYSSLIGVEFDIIREDRRR